MTKKTTEKGKETYLDHAAEASRPISQRKPVSQGRQGTLPPRRRHLLPDQQDELLKRMADDGGFVSPYKRFGAYDGLVMALARLGENESHALGQVLGEFERYMSDEDSKDGRDRTAWDRFRDKKSRSEKTGLDHMGRLKQNVTVLQRMGGEHPYALKLAQLGCCVDIMKGERGEFRVRLRTGVPIGDDIVPKNEFRSRDCPRSVMALRSQMRFAGTTSPSRGPVSDGSGKD